MITPKWPMWKRVALGAGLFVFGGIVVLWDAAAARREETDYGPRW